MNAQVVEVVDSLKSVSPLSPAKSVKRQDTINLQDFKIDTSLSNLNFSYSDSLMLDLKDQKKAKSSDSLWLKELYDSTRFEEVFGSITSEEIELTEYEDLPTELLKNRLEQLDAKTPFDISYNPSLERLIKHRKKVVT